MRRVSDSACACVSVSVCVWVYVSSDSCPLIDLRCLLTYGAETWWVDRLYPHLTPPWWVDRLYPHLDPLRNS